MSAKKAFPTPGTVVLIEHTMWQDKWQLARVVKTGKVMWEIEPVVRDGIGGQEIKFDAPCRRKVAWWREIPPGTNIAKLHFQMTDLYDLQRQQKRQAVEDYKRTIHSILDEAEEEVCHG